jgi:hypothetical protein
MIVLNICKQEINWKEAKNGKHYANVATDFLKEPDEKGNTHTVWNNQSADERAEKAKKNYCGRGKQVSYNSPMGKKEFAQNLNEIAVNQQESEDDLPF